VRESRAAPYVCTRCHKRQTKGNTYLITGGERVCRRCAIVGCVEFVITEHLKEKDMARQLAMTNGQVCSIIPGR
jgi:hypothetical protein